MNFYLIERIRIHLKSSKGDQQNACNEWGIFSVCSIPTHLYIYTVVYVAHIYTIYNSLLSKISFLNFIPWKLQNTKVEER